MPITHDNEIQAVTTQEQTKTSEPVSARRQIPAPGRPGDFQEGLDLLMKKYDNALRELAK